MFIGGKTNRKILDHPPAEYLPGLIAKAGGKVFATQCVPTGDGVLKVDRYKDFLAERREKIAQRLNQFLAQN